MKTNQFVSYAIYLLPDQMRLRWRRHASFFISFWRWFVLAFFILSVYIVFHISSERSSAELEQEISRLSVYYVRALAREKKLHHAGDVDVVDLQKTMSVLLHTMLQRVNSVESVVARNLSGSSVLRHQNSEDNQLVPHSATKSSHALSASDLLSSDSSTFTTHRLLRKEKKLFQSFVSFNRMKSIIPHIGTKCELPSDWPATYPECEGKLEWMNQFHSSHPCYSSYGVDGSHCASVVYLSEVENFCPRSPDVEIRPPARQATDPGDLPAILATAPDEVLSRVQATWPTWMAAGRQLAANKKHVNGSQLRIVLIPLGVKEAADSELATMMWADLASALHLLGHKLIWVQSLARLKGLVKRMQDDTSSPCQARMTLFVDVIYTDGRGMEELRKALGQSFSRVACVLRVLRESGLIPLAESPPSNLRWRQFLTPYPTFDDHTFLGFALEKNAAPVLPTRRRFALVLGSRTELFKGAGPYLAAVADNFPLHTLLNSAAERSRVAQLLSPHVPEFTNHHITGDRLQRLSSLLSSALVVVGLGKPFDPALALMAIAQGAVFLNPRFDSPRHVIHNTSTLKDEWRVTSQHTYLERFVASPYVVNVPVDQPKAIPERLKGAAKLLQNVAPYVPYAFSHLGYLKRLAFFLRTQDFCTPNPNPLEPVWPPVASVEFYLSVKGDSCEKTCARKNRVCEPNYFPVINSRVELQERNIECKSSYFQPNPSFPAFSPAEKTCYFQSDPERYSCFRSPNSMKLLRICPCRDHQPDQISLCKGCL